MPLTRLTSRGHHANASIRYITTGHYGKGGTFNQPHANRGDKSITKRNYFLDGVNCHSDPKRALKDFDYYLSKKPHNKIKCFNIVLSYGDNLDWRNPLDLYYGIRINHEFLKRAVPNHCVYSGYQMDTSTKIPNSHTHDCVCAINMKTLNSMRGATYNIHRLQRIADNITDKFNIKHPWIHLTEMEHYAGKPHHNRLPTPFEKDVITRIKPVLNQVKRGEIKDEHQFKTEALRHGAYAYFTHQGTPTGKYYHGKMICYHDGLSIKTKHSHGPIRASQLSEFIPQINIHRLKYQFTLNQELTQSIKFTHTTNQPKSSDSSWQKNLSSMNIDNILNQAQSAVNNQQAIHNSVKNHNDKKRSKRTDWDELKDTVKHLHVNLTQLTRHKISSYIGRAITIVKRDTDKAKRKVKDMAHQLHTKLNQIIHKSKAVKHLKHAIYHKRHVKKSSASTAKTSSKADSVSTNPAILNNDSIGESVVNHEKSVAMAKSLIADANRRESVKKAKLDSMAQEDAMVYGSPINPDSMSTSSNASNVESVSQSSSESTSVSQASQASMSPSASQSSDKQSSDDQAKRKKERKIRIYRIKHGLGFGN